MTIGVSVRCVPDRDAYSRESGYQMSITCDLDAWRGTFFRAVTTALADMIANDDVAGDIVVYYTDGSRTVRVSGDVTAVEQDGIIVFGRNHDAWEVSTDDVISIHW